MSFPPGSEEIILGINLRIGRACHCFPYIIIRNQLDSVMPHPQAQLPASLGIGRGRRGYHLAGIYAISYIHQGIAGAGIF